MRGERLLNLITDCRVSLHDLSRQRTRSGHPRMNMPFEAGLACAVAWLGRDHTIFILEAQRYRLQRTLSDLNGTDPYIHGGTPDGMVRAVLEMLRRPHRHVRVTDAQRVVAQLRISARDIRRRWDGDLFRPGVFDELVLAAHQLAEATLVTT
jgi:hypothetical protein